MDGRDIGKPIPPVLSLCETRNRALGLWRKLGAFQRLPNEEIQSPPVLATVNLTGQGKAELERGLKAAEPKVSW